MFGVLLVIKPHIEVRPDRVHYSHGQSATIIQAVDLRRSRIIVFTPTRKQLALWYDRKGKQRLLKVGIAEKVELDRLCQLLPVKPAIRDARENYRRLFLDAPTT